MKKISLSIILVLFFYFVNFANNDIEVPKRSNNNKSIRYYKADIEYGEIGVFDIKNGDNLIDNIFKFNIDQEISKTDKVYLEYELFGLADAIFTSKSINGGFATGGYALVKTKKWKKIKEPISYDWLKKGYNYILFAPANNATPYKIKNIKIIIERDDLQKDNAQIVFSSTTKYKYNDKLILKGFIKNYNKFSHFNIEIDGVKYEINLDGSFEFIHDKAIENREFVNVKLISEDKTIYQKDIIVKNAIEVEKFNKISKIPTFSYHRFGVKADKFFYDKIGIVIEDGSLVEEKNISISKLRNIDIPPLETSMVNVTANGSGVRFLPDGTKFEKPVKIYIPFDKNKIPQGYSPSDITTFYFDVKAKLWKMLKKDSVDMKNGVIISSTTHFTDYINGIIKVPESPQTSSFTPTMMNDIKAAQPLTGLTIVQPPKATQTGDAVINFPIKIPSGRNGMQPDLTLKYNSSAGNGFLGLGWSMSIPSITVNTKWGVPRFEQDYESEMYQLNGEDLMYPKYQMLNDPTYYDYMPNRPRYVNGNPVTTNPQPRSSTKKTFTLRNQNAQMRIERLGNSPSEYYWKVTSPDGTISWYGGNEKGINENSIIRNDDGNIVHWAINKTIDVYGNTIIYNYYNKKIVTQSSSSDNSMEVILGLSQENQNLLNGKIFHIQNIYYTGYKGKKGNYTINFGYDSHIIRNDININFSRTVKEVEPFLLNEINVLYNERLIRKYSLNFSEGAFKKELLKSVIEYGVGGNEIINENTFDYGELKLKDSGPDFNLFSNTMLFNNNDNSAPSYFLSSVRNHSDLGTTETFDFSFSTRFGFAVQLLKPDKKPLRNLGGGFTLGFGYMPSKGRTTFVDIDGDGIIDLVFVHGDNLYYKKGYINNMNLLRFDSAVQNIMNISNFSSSVSHRFSFNFNLGASLGSLFFNLGLGNVYSQLPFINDVETVTKIYFTDGNSDGLVDIVKADADNNYVVYFNHVESDGTLSFSPSSLGTENVLVTGHVNIEDAPALNLQEDNEEQVFESLANLFNFDMVRVWIAPHDGFVKIGDTVSFSSSDPEDKILYSIETAMVEHVNDSPNSINHTGTPFRLYIKEFSNTLQQDNINIDNYYSGVPVSLLGFNGQYLDGYEKQGLYVKAGQMIFFRIQTNDTKNIMPLNSSPTVTYTSNNSSGQFIESSNYSDVYLLHDYEGEELTEEGVYNVSWIDFGQNFSNSNQTTDVKYEIKVKLSAINTGLKPNYSGEFPIFSQEIHAGHTVNLGNDIANWEDVDITDINNNLLLSFDKASKELTLRPNIFNNYIVTIRYEVNAIEDHSQVTVDWKSLEWKPLLTYHSQSLNLDRYIYPITIYNFDPMEFSFNIDKDLKHLYLYRNWGQFIYSSRKKDDPVAVYDDKGVLIHHPDVWDFNINSNALQGLDTYFSNYPQDNEEQVQNSLQNDLQGLNNAATTGTISNPNSLSDMYQGNDLGLLMEDASNNTLSNLTFLPTKPIRKNKGEIEQWQGITNKHYSRIGSLRNTRFFSIDNLPGNSVALIQDMESESPGMQFDSNYGMFATEVKSINKSTNYSISSSGVSLAHSNIRRNKSFTRTFFMDVNGDGYPDILKGNRSMGFVYLTNSLGSHTNSNYDWKNVITFSRGKNTSINASYSNGLSKGILNTGQKTKFQINGNPTVSMGTNIDLGSVSFSDNYWLDINGDGLPDKIFVNGDTNSRPDESDIKVGFNNGNGGNFLNESSGTTFMNLLPEEYIPYRNISFNANIGLSDLLSLFGDDWSVNFGLDMGFTPSHNRIKVKYVDLNNDGLIDIIYNNPNPVDDYFENQNNFIVRFNLGNKFSEETNLSIYDFNDIRYSTGNSVSLTGNVDAKLTSTPILIIFGFPVLYSTLNTSIMATASHTLSLDKMSFSDLNGDGYLDFVYKDNNKYYYKINNLSKAETFNQQANVPINKLYRVTNSITDARFDISYKYIKPTYRNNKPKLVLSEVSVYDGLNVEDSNQTDLDGTDIYTTRYEYENAKYDRREREFYGFEKVTTIDGYYDSNEHFHIYRKHVNEYYNNSYFMHGLLKKSYLTDANDNIINETTNQYKLYKVDREGKLSGVIANAFDNNGIDIFDVGGGEGRRQAAVLLTETISKTYDLQGQGSGNMLSTNMSLKYDNLGRVTEASYTDNNGYAYTSKINYHNYQSLNDKNIINVPALLTVETSDGIIRQRETNVDTSTGDIIQIISKISSNHYAVVDMKYDEFGNLIKIVYPKNHNRQRLEYEYTYDNTLHKYVTSIIDSYGYISQAEYNPMFDVVNKTIDLGGAVISRDYDSAGRLIKIKGPKDPDYTITFEYRPENHYAITKHFDSQHRDNAIETITFSDGLGRIVQVKKDIELKGREFMSVSGLVKYDSFGRVVLERHPVSEPKNPTENKIINTDISNYYKRYSYDILDRKTQITDEEGNTTEMKYGIENINVMGHSLPAAFNYVKIPQNNSQYIEKYSYINTLGKSVLSKSIGDNGQVIKTQFKYDNIGQLLMYQDDQEMTTSFKYDMLGRPIWEKHPDKGITTKKYDPAGNLIALTTANLAENHQSIIYEYNFNQLMKIKFPEIEGQENISNVSYKYGGPNDGLNAGRVIYQKDASGEQYFEYGNMGELKLIDRIINIPGMDNNMKFKTFFEYDSWNRIQNIIYPDGEKVSYIYDLGGNLKSVRGDYIYLDNISYDEYEQRVSVKYGNGTVTSYHYLPTRRLLNKMNVNSNAGELLSLEYRYDKAGNIITINNNADTTNDITGIYNFNYSYDKLNRLVKSEGSFEPNYEAPKSTYSTKLTYNTTFGIINKTQSHIHENTTVLANTYDNHYTYYDHTHKIKEINSQQGRHSQSFLYDANGNLTFHKTEDNIRQHYWDESNRLRVVRDENSNNFSHYIYDASGERVLKAKGIDNIIAENGQIISHHINLSPYKVYPSAYLVVDIEKGYSKHYFAGTQRLASRLLSNYKKFIIPTRKNKTNFGKEYKPKVNYTALTKIDLKHYLGKDFKFSFAKMSIDKNNNSKAPGSIYWFHPNHLGSGTLITDINGNPYQFFLNLPFGETFVDKHSHTGYYENVYKFNGKELDTETGYYYYGARYYNPRISQFYATDPLAEKYPNFSPYTYTADNPVMLVDPKGMFFKRKNQRKASRYLRRIERKLDRIYKRMNRSKNNKQIEKLKNRAKELGKSMDDIIDMNNDEMVEYRFSHSGTSSSSLTKENGKWIYTISANGMANKIHEIKHGGQVARKEMNPKTGWRYGVNDEVEAYKAQWAWKGEITDYFQRELTPDNIKEYIQNRVIFFKKTIYNYDNITPSLINSMLDDSFKNRYPPENYPKGKNYWNSN